MVRGVTFFSKGAFFSLCEHTKYERNQYSCSWDIENRHARAHVL